MDNNIIEKYSKQLENQTMILKKLTEQVMTIKNQAEDKNASVCKELISELEEIKNRWLSSIDELEREKNRYNKLSNEIENLKIQINKIKQRNERKSRFKLFEKSGG